MLHSLTKRRHSTCRDDASDQKSDCEGTPRRMTGVFDEWSLCAAAVGVTQTSHWTHE